MLNVGITGGIGSGKTVVCNILSHWGIPIFNADIEAKQIIDNNSEVQEEVKKIFGRSVFNNQNRFDRKKMSDIVFNDRKSLENLNNIVHPFVKEMFLDWAELQSSPYVVEEAAILFESGSYKQMDKIIMVFCEQEVRIDRIIKRNGFSREKVISIMANQMDETEKCKKADYVVTNNEKTLLLPQLLKIHNELISYKG